MLPFSVICQTDTLQLDTNAVILNVCGSLPDSVDASDKIHDLVEKEPEYPGGEGAMMSFISSNLKLPFADFCYSGNVYLQCIIEVDGEITNVKCIRGINTDVDAICVRLIEKMPNWVPGEINGKPVRVRYTLPIQVCYR